MPQPSEHNQPNVAVEFDHEWEALPLGELHQLDALCVRFEQSLNDETDSPIEIFVADLTESQQRLVVCELVSLEIEWKASRGQTPAPDDYIRRFPQWAKELRAILALQLESLDQEQPASEGTQKFLTDDTAFVLTRDQFLERLTASDILPPGESQKIREDQSDVESAVDGKQLARLMVEQDVLTPYQAQQLFANEGQSLVLGNYVILDRIGQGGMGKVFKARHKRMKRVVALKVLPPELTGNLEALRRFEREAEAAALLTHPNIVTAYDADEMQNTHFLVMEYVQGTDLSKLLRQLGSLPIETVVDYVLQVARGLEYAHSRGIVHRDVKPANLLLDETGMVKILDMGLARLSSSGIDADRQSSVGLPQPIDKDQDQLTSIGQVMGTVDYMAPEQAGNTKAVDARADIYSLGVTLWHLATGNVVYAGSSPVEKLLAHESAPIPSLAAAISGVPAKLDATFSKMVAKLPEDRFQTMREVVAALEACKTIEIEKNRLDLSFSEPGPQAAGIAARSSTDTNRVDEISLSESSAFSSPDAMAETINLIATSPETDPRSAFFEAPVDQHLSELTTRSATQPPVIPGWRQRVFLAIVGGVAALFFSGFIIIMITRKDGSTLKVVVPDDVRNVEITEPADVPGAAAANTPPSSTRPAASQQFPEHEWSKNAPPPAIAPFNTVEAKQHQQAWADYLKVPVEYANSLGMKFRLIPPGEFLMGVESSEIDLVKLRLRDENEKKEFEAAVSAATPRHRVRITRPYYLQTHEVTFSLLKQVVGKLPTGAEFSKVFPAACNHISLLDAVLFCNELSKREGKAVVYHVDGTLLSRRLTADGYRLPTEAEWEYACRAGTTSIWFFGNDQHGDGPDYSSLLQRYQTRWHGSEAKANPFGLVDMYAGSNEWCFDRYLPYESKAVVDPYTPPGSSKAVCRGGSVYAGSGNSVIANNSFYRCDDSDESSVWHGLGRVVLPIPLPSTTPAKPLKDSSSNW